MIIGLSTLIYIKTTKNRIFENTYVLTYIKMVKFQELVIFFKIFERRNLLFLDAKTVYKKYNKI